MFDKQINSNSFFNLADPNLQAENVSAYIASDVSSIYKFFNDIGSQVSITLMSGSKVLATVQIPLNALQLDEASLNVHGNEMEVDNIAYFPTSDCDSPGDERAYIGYGLALAVDSAPVQNNNDTNDDMNVEEKHMELEQQQEDAIRKATEDCVMNLENWKLEQKEKFKIQVMWTLVFMCHPGSGQAKV